MTFDDWDLDLIPFSPILANIVEISYSMMHTDASSV